LRGAHRAASPAPAARPRSAAPAAGLVPRRRGLPGLGGCARAHRLRAERAARGRGDRAPRRAVLSRAPAPKPAPGATMSLLEAERLSSACGPRTVLDDVHLALGGGEIVGLIGPNGCGKSTLVRLLAGLVRPRTGTLRVAGRPIASWTRIELARQVALVPQD